MKKGGHVLIVCERFHDVAGGVERASTALMNQLVERGWRVSLLTMDEIGVRPFYSLNPEIEWHQVGTEAKTSKRILAIRRILKNDRPDVVVGFQLMMFLFGYACVFGFGVPVVAAERNAISQYRIMGSGSLPYFKNIAALTLSSGISVQDPGFIDFYPWWLKGKIGVTPNPIWPAGGGSVDRKKMILNVGRLCPQKNQRFLIESFALISTRAPDWNLVIVGEGEERSHLEFAIRKFGLERRVCLYGVTSDIGRLYNEASILAFPSLFEGFPNVVGEAMVREIPTVALTGSPGVGTLVTNKVTGLLTAGDPVEFSEALFTLIENPKMREEMGQNAAHKAGEYAPDKMIDQWERFLLIVIKNSLKK